MSSKNMVNKGVQLYGAYFGGIAAVISLICAIVLIYVGATNMNNKQDPNYENVVLDKIRSSIICITGASPAYCNDEQKRYKNVYSHAQCSNHSEKAPYTSTTYYPGPSNKTMERHKQTFECREPPLSNKQGMILFIIGIVLLVFSIFTFRCLYYEECRRVMGGYFMLKSIFGSNNNYSFSNILKI